MTSSLVGDNSKVSVVVGGAAAAAVVSVRADELAAASAIPLLMRSTMMTMGIPLPSAAASASSSSSSSAATASPVPYLHHLVAGAAWHLQPPQHQPQQPPQQPQAMVVVATAVAAAAGHELNSLPAELVFHVLSFLPAEDVLRTVPLVCSLWRDLTRDQTLWKSVVQREFDITFSDEAARQMTAPWPQFCHSLLSRRAEFDISYHDASRKVLGCRHYQRNNKIIAECCQRLFVCRHCHNAEKDHQIDRYATKFMYCMICRTIQPKGQVCTSPVCEGKSMATYFCGVCNFWDDMPDKAIFHCSDCNVCYLGKGLGVDYYHCTECNMCFDKRYEANHRHIPRKKMRSDAEPESTAPHN